MSHITENLTFAMIKPEAVKKNVIGSIIALIEEKNFTVCGLSMVRLTLERAQAFYKVHEDRPFYQALCDYMCTGKIVAMVLKKENAVQDFRTLIGATNPKEALAGTIRNQFGTSIEENAIHGSDSDTNAQKEIHFFFNQ